MNKRTTRSILLASVMGMTLALSACGSDEPTTGSSGSDEATTEEATTEETTSEAPAADAPFGAACADVPTEGEGSVEGMADDPVATAASNNPLLSTLVEAVGVAGLGDTLNTTDNLTVFAPSNAAFMALPPDTLAAVLADVPLLTSILTYHVIGERLAPDALAGTFPTLNGAELTIEGDGEMFTTNVGGTPTASVVCGNVQTANATVYIIDQVMMPPAA